MTGRVKGIIKRILLLCIILAIIGFVLNWFLAGKLERYLRSTLSEIVSNETGGFYRLEYEKLDIGLFNGELSIKGVRFKPDSATYHQWKQQDSLPPVYADVSIGSIDFKGINLAWRWSYTNLDFKLFEINKPIISIYDSSNSGKVDTVSKNITPQSLYGLISPFISVLTVQRMNLNNASVTYISQGQDRPSVYALKDVTFHAYGFRLDENSYSSGKLLYCDDFDFMANQPQALLTNDQMILNADAINLNTQDSIIKIEGINLIPQKMLWAQMNRTPESYIEANTQSLEVRGIQFKRENAKNYLEARSFNIDNSDLKYFDIQRSQSAKTVQVDSINLSWTLYAIISPILQSISVNQISINDATLGYSTISDEVSDYYQMDKFDFNAYNFLVDSLADKQKKFLYSESFDVKANGIQATIASKNHVFSIYSMNLDARNGELGIKDIQVWPWSTKTELDYMKGSIDSIAITGMVYDKGLRAKEFNISTPVMEYVKMPSRLRKRVTKEVIRTDTIPSPRGGVSTIDLITPFFGFIAVGTINLDKGNITFRDRGVKGEVVYKLPKIDFYATGALVNEETINHSDSYFTYKDLRFRFEGFDNILSGEGYRLKINSGVYTGMGGDLRLKGINLVTHEGQATPESIHLTIPEVNFKGVNYRIDSPRKIFRINQAEILSPKLDIEKGRSVEKQLVNKQSPVIFNISFNDLIIRDAGLRYVDLVKRDSILFALNQFQVKSLKWNSGDKLAMQDVVINSPLLKIEKKSKGNKPPSNRAGKQSDFFVKNIDVGNLSFNNIDFSLNEPDFSLSFLTNHFALEKLTWNKNSAEIGSFKINSPIIKTNSIVYSEELKKSDRKEREESFYQRLSSISKVINVGAFHLADAEIDYSTTLNGRTFREQQVNSTNLDFSGLMIDAGEQTFNLQDFNFSTKNLRFPIDNGFYILRVGEVELHKRDSVVRLENIHLIPAYPKEEFAYHHPNHKDWFDVSAKSVRLSGIDYPTYFSDKRLNIKYARIKEPKLLNYKNQQIEIEHNIMPMLYEGIQKAPIPFRVDALDVNDMYILYEELPKKGDVPGKILFTDMKGRFTDLTNIVEDINQYIRLDANGKFMGAGDLSAIWLLPVDSLNDNFLLSAHLRKFDLRELNPIFEPLAAAKVNSGMIDSMLLKTEASSKGATVQMRLIYNGLNVSVLKAKDGETEPNRFVTGLANMVIKTNNPDRRNKGAREPYLTIERDPYHSTFNYLWQILRPSLVESVGVSQKTQNFFKGVSGVISKVKNFFTGGNKKEKEVEENK